MLRVADKRAYRPFTRHGRISNACFLFLTSELNFENEITWVHNAKKGKLGRGREKAAMCVLQGIKKQDLCVNYLIIAFKN